MAAANQDEVNALVERWRQGDECAAERIFTLYWERLWLLAKSRIDKRLVLQRRLESYAKRIDTSHYAIARQLCPC